MHIGIIMDGNGRWATARGLLRSQGHREGVRALKRVVAALDAYGVSCVTVFAFSTENWKRSAAEVNGLFKLVADFADEGGDRLRLRFMGRLSELPEKVQFACRDAERKSANNNGIMLNIALNYGGQDDVLNAARELALSGKKVISKADFEDRLYTKGLPQLDLIVRTGGEKRLSNFMLYQAAYAEIVFLDTLWPDMTESDVKSFMDEYKQRKRKFGGV